MFFKQIFHKQAGINNAAPHILTRVNFVDYLLSAYIPMVAPVNPPVRSHAR